MSVLAKHPQLLHALGRTTVGEIKIALAAQAIGISAFVAAAIIYGLITIPSPAPVVDRPPSPPTEYQLTPEPTIVPHENFNAPWMVSKRDYAEHTQVVSMMMNSLDTKQVEYVSRASLPTKIAGKKLALGQIKEFPSPELLDWTLDVTPTALIKYQVPSIGDAGELLKKLISESKGNTPQAIMIVIMNPPEGTDFASWKPVSFNLVKDSQRLLFVDANFKVSEVFDTGEANLR